MQRTKNNIVMKVMLIIIAAFSFQTSTLIANNIGDVVISTIPTDLFCPECPILIPKVPLEAPFREITEFVNPVDLTPLVPMEVTFNDDAETELTSRNLVPVLPMQADFDDEVLLIEPKSRFAPVVPATADFYDKL